MNTALLVIDLQNDYFPGGSFPLWNTADTLDHVEAAVKSARAKGIPVILIQHIAHPETGMAPFYAYRHFKIRGKIYGLHAS